MKMRRVEAISLPAGKPVELGPGGYHVMLMDVGQPLKEGETVPLTLTFADKAGNRTTRPCRPPSARSRRQPTSTEPRLARAALTARRHPRTIGWTT